MAIQDEVSTIETLTTNRSETFFAAAPRIHQTEVAKLIESAHGAGAVDKFFDDVHREGSLTLTFRMASNYGVPAKSIWSRKTSAVGLWAI